MRYLRGKIICQLMALAILLQAMGASAIPYEQWSKKFGGVNNDIAYSVNQTLDGGYILAGQTESYGFGGGDFWLIKTDVNGSQQWSKTFGGTSTDVAYSVQQTLDSGYVLTGYTFSYGSGVSDVWLIKTDANGNQQWNKTFGGTNTDEANSVQQTSDGGYILAGRTQSYGAGFDDVWLIKTDTSGNQQWSKTFGGTSGDLAFSVQQTLDGGYALAGQTVSYGFGGGDVWLIKTDVNGNQQWNKTFGGTSSEVAYSVQQTMDGGFIMAGSISIGQYGAGGYDFWLIKTDVNGNQQWNKTFGGLYNEEAKSVQQTSDGGYILTGNTYSYGSGEYDAWLIKTDANGNELWNKTFGGPNFDEASFVRQTTDDGYILAGRTKIYWWGNSDAWLIKVSNEMSAVQNIIGYSAFVATGQNTYVQSSNGTFGLLLRGQTKTINNSVILNNTGDISARVEARFNDSVSGIYGLISGANVLNATNFALGLPSALMPLSSLGADVQVAVAPPGATAMDARLGVPAEQASGDYSGTVILTFSNNV